MNTYKTRLVLPALLSAAVLAALVGCKDRNTTPAGSTADVPAPAPAVTATPGESAVGEAWDKTKSTAKEMYSDAKDATMDGIDRLDRATYDERATVKAKLAEAGAKLDTEVASWGRDGKKLSSTSNEKLVKARSQFDASLDSLGSATAEGWEAAKAKTAAAWADVKAAYAQAKAEHAG